jgi:hypothetical protein
MSQDEVVSPEEDMHFDKGHMVAFLPPSTKEKMANLGCKHGLAPDHYTRSIKIGRSQDLDDRPWYARTKCSACKHYAVIASKPWKGLCSVKAEERKFGACGCEQFAVRQGSPQEERA